MGARPRRARMVMLGLPGSAYVYQGDELGLPEHTTLPTSLRQDPSFFRTGGAERGRDGCRVPLPWVAAAPGFGFGPYPATGRNTPARPRAAPGVRRPWLPQPAGFARYAADRQVGVPGSTYELYRELLGLRAEHALGRGRLEWAAPHAPEAGILAFRNGPVLVVANMGRAPVALPQGWRPPPPAGTMPSRTARWSRTPACGCWRSRARARGRRGTCGRGRRRPGG